ncbi:MAG TPA: hypothetical protein PLI18_14570 [Pirellulaceae bacterium]|nr:hypothetical protein [Pirellulaceae bacterium]
MLIYDRGVALIRRMTDQGPEWLLRWNPTRECSELIEADRLSGETYREALYREIDWQLGLDRKKDYLMSSVPRLHFELTPCGRVHPAKTFEPETANYGRLELYAVEVYRAPTLERLAADEKNCWTRPIELLEGVDGQGRALREDQFRWLERTEAIGR